MPVTMKCKVCGEEFTFKSGFTTVNICYKCAKHNYLKWAKCELCDKDLKWGDFGHDQRICWDCFAREVCTMRDVMVASHVKNELSLWPNKGEWEGMLMFMLHLTADKYGKKRNFPELGDITNIEGLRDI